jgi:hypothetical protein
MATTYNTQNQLLLNNLLHWYKNTNNIDNMLDIINGKSQLSLRIVDWFTTNFAKKYGTVYNMNIHNDPIRFSVYSDYKLKLKAYSKKRFDPFCRWSRITIPYNDNAQVVTTIGQLNFFKWALENKVIEYIENNYKVIELDMNNRNSTSKRKNSTKLDNSTRKKREELSISATKSIKKEHIEITLQFN